MCYSKYICYQCDMILPVGQTIKDHKCPYTSFLKVVFVKGK
jgi:hypothetical protein